MIRLRLTDPADVPPHAIAAARAELARLTADHRPTYLGMRARTVIVVGLAAVTIGAAIGLALPTPLERFAPCGLTVDGGEVVPASCATGAELAERTATIRAERSGGRW
jgi:hypothetical protein